MDGQRQARHSTSVSNKGVCPAEPRSCVHILLMLREAYSTAKSPLFAHVLLKLRHCRPITAASDFDLPPPTYTCVVEKQHMGILHYTPDQLKVCGFLLCSLPMLTLHIVTWSRNVIGKDMVQPIILRQNVVACICVLLLCSSHMWQLSPVHAVASSMTMQ